VRGLGRAPDRALRTSASGGQTGSALGRGAHHRGHHPPVQVAVSRSGQRRVHREQVQSVSVDGSSSIMRSAWAEDGVVGRWPDRSGSTGCRRRCPGNRGALAPRRGGREAGERQGRRRLRGLPVTAPPPRDRLGRKAPDPNPWHIAGQLDDLDEFVRSRTTRTPRLSRKAATKRGPRWPGLPVCAALARTGGLGGPTGQYPTRLPAAVALRAGQRQIERRRGTSRGSRQ